MLLLNNLPPRIFKIRLRPLLPHFLLLIPFNLPTRTTTDHPHSQFTLTVIFIETFTISFFLQGRVSGRFSCFRRPLVNRTNGVLNSRSMSCKYLPHQPPNHEVTGRHIADYHRTSSCTRGGEE